MEWREEECDRCQGCKFADAEIYTSHNIEKYLDSKEHRAIKSLSKAIGSKLKSAQSTIPVEEEATYRETTYLLYDAALMMQLADEEFDQYHNMVNEDNLNTASADKGSGNRLRENPESGNNPYQITKRLQKLRNTECYLTKARHMRKRAFYIASSYNLQQDLLDAPNMQAKALKEDYQRTLLRHKQYVEASAATQPWAKLSTKSFVKRDPKTRRWTSTTLTGEAEDYGVDPLFADSDTDGDLDVFMTKCTTARKRKSYAERDWTDSEEEEEWALTYMQMNRDSERARESEGKKSQNEIHQAEKTSPHKKQPSQRQFLPTRSTARKEKSRMIEPTRETNETAEAIRQRQMKYFGPRPEGNLGLL
jgi:hypothetical protein